MIYACNLRGKEYASIKWSLQNILKALNNAYINIKQVITIMFDILKLLFIALFFVSCGNSSDEIIEPVSLETKLTLRDSFNQEVNTFIQGEDIDVILTLTNNTADEITLNFGSNQQHDLYLISSANVEIWRWSSDKAFLTVITQLVIQSGETKEISTVWNQQLLNGENVSTGDYALFGSFLDQSPEAEIALTIQ